MRHARPAHSERVEYARYNSDASTVLAQTRHAYESTRDVLDYVENRAGASLPVVSKYDYTNDDLARRTAVIHSGSAFAATHNFGWGYNDRSELTAADRYTGTAPGTHTASPFAFGYEYDNIGNRQTYTQDEGAPSVYTANDLNQYEQITPGNQQLAYDEDGNLVRMGASLMGDFDADGDVDLKDFLQFQICFGQTGVGGGPCAFFDFDANGTIDQADYTAFYARVTGPDAPRPVIYTWDAENRLASVEPEVLAEGAKRVEFTYDYVGRRVRRIVSTYTTGQWVEDIDGDQLFVYDGWNVVLVLDANAASATLRKYTWGLDLSGTIHGAGGIGGLLAVEEATGPNIGSYWFFYDGNGNVGQVIRADDQTGAARYEYDPYGNPILTDGPYAASNTFRFSTKWLDPETGLCYYGYRYYSPRLGRWLNRDPLRELAGRNLYGFVRGNPIGRIDPFGLWEWADVWSGATQVGMTIYYLPQSYVETMVPGQQWSSAAGAIDAMTAALNPFGDGTDFGPQFGYTSEYAQGQVAGNVAGVALNAAMTVCGVKGVVTGIQAIQSAGGLVQVAALLTTTGETVPVIVSNGEAVVATAQTLAKLGMTEAAIANLLKTGEGGAPPPEPTGQQHHAISKKVQEALDNHQNLKGKYQYREGRWCSRGKDLNSHKGYHDWHRKLDQEIADWINTYKEATREQFEEYLRQLYSRPDLMNRFPNGMPGGS